MRYEKKMLILSGNGKGVVVIERSGAGVKFNLNAFDLMQGAILKAGIVTPRTVIIRDLPPVNGSTLTATFRTNDLELDKLHFALFDTEIALYGAVGERMWESNLTDILMRRDRLTSPTPIPLPLVPSGEAEYTRIPPPEKRAYLDEPAPRDNFYTPFDYSARMPEVDAFLDSPRVLTGSILDGLAPTVTPHAAEPTAAQAQAENADGDENEIGEVIDIENAEVEAETVQDDTERNTEREINQAQTAEQIMQTEAFTDKQANESAEQAQTENVCEQARDVAAPVQSDEASQNIESLDEVAATAETVEPKRLPWELEARYLSARGGRKVVSRPSKIEPVRQGQQVKKLRDMMFFERSRADIDKLFSSAAKDETLSGLLKDVEWIKVELSGGTVSVGRGGDSFLCYAVSGTYALNPFGEEAQWLPTQAASPTERGYWLVFQSLATGEIIRTE